MNAISAKNRHVLPPGPGRPKQSPSLCNGELLEALQKECKRRYGLDRYDPVIAMAEIACDPSNPVELRLNAHANVAKYVRAQLKHVEVTGAGGGPIETKNVVVDNLIGAILSGGEGSNDILNLLSQMMQPSNTAIDVTPTPSEDKPA